VSKRIKRKENYCSRVNNFHFLKGKIGKVEKGIMAAKEIELFLILSGPIFAFFKRAVPQDISRSLKAKVGPDIESGI